MSNPEPRRRRNEPRRDRVSAPRPCSPSAPLLEFWVRGFAVVAEQVIDAEYLEWPHEFGRHVDDEQVPSLLLEREVGGHDQADARRVHERDVRAVDEEMHVGCRDELLELAAD